MSNEAPKTLTEGERKNQYVIDNILTRTKSLGREFPYLQSSKEFMNCLKEIGSLYKNPPENIEKARKVHERLISILSQAQEQAENDIVGIEQGRRTILEVADSIINFDEIIERVEDNGDEIEDSISSAADSFLGHETGGNKIELNEIVLQYRQEVSKRALEILRDLYVNYDDEDEYTFFPSQVEERIGTEGIFELLGQPDEELEELAIRDPELTSIIDLILDVREHIEEGTLMGADNPEDRILETDRILYEPKAIFYEGVETELHDFIGELSSREEKILRMLRGVQRPHDSEFPLEHMDLPRLTGSRINNIENDAIARTNPPSPSSDNNNDDRPEMSEEDKTPEPQDLENVVSIADFKRRKSISEFVPARAKARKNSMNS